MQNVLSLINSDGVPFNVVIVENGGSYGLNSCLTHDSDDALVEFYDARYPHTEHGQFVTRYYASTMLKHEDGYGLCLDGGVRQWRVTAYNMIQVKEFLENLV